MTVNFDFGDKLREAYHKSFEKDETKNEIDSPVNDESSENSSS